VNFRDLNIKNIVYYWSEGNSISLVVVEEGCLVPFMRETGPEGHYTAK